ncbi:MAG TPA: Imm26 family immunity protein [Archangium sp.]|uniref:Imm26 family immunity protein n=1 Tax=Archangium sp. TaxID=1872627 RepID=UPI002E31AE14|nr:Imm26 family immunity protein [Archangium sp.]HEX5749898.1 Imm26 family immunity protein [Archangium sp.]
MGRRKHTTGAFFRIALADGSFGYARLLEPPYMAFYDYRTTIPDSDLDRISSSPVLFRIAVRHLALNEWEVLGHRALEAPLTEPVVQFMQDLGDFHRCTIFDTAGNERAAEPRECVGLERAAVWERDSVEGRLLDAFLGRPNADVEHLEVRLH